MGYSAASIARAAVALPAVAGCLQMNAGVPTAAATAYDGVILNGTVYDGSGTDGVAADVAIADGRIIALGNFDAGDVRAAGFVIDATGKAVAPGFINMLNWAAESLIHFSDLMKKATPKNI